MNSKSLLSMSMGIPVNRLVMFSNNQSVVTSSTIPHLPLSKQWTALSYHRVRETICAKVYAFFGTGITIVDPHGHCCYSERYVESKYEGTQKKEYIIKKKHYYDSIIVSCYYKNFRLHIYMHLYVCY